METVTEENDSLLQSIQDSAPRSIPSLVPRIDPNSIPSPVLNLDPSFVPTFTNFGTNPDHSVNSNTRQFNLNCDQISNAYIDTDLGFGSGFCHDLVSAPSFVPSIESSPVPSPVPGFDPSFVPRPAPSSVDLGTDFGFGLG